MNSVLTVSLLQRILANKRNSSIFRLDMVLTATGTKVVNCRQLRSLAMYLGIIALSILLIYLEKVRLV